MYRWGTLFIVLFLFHPLGTLHAQVNVSFNGNDSVLQVTDGSVTPGSLITLSLKNTSIPLETKNISWLENGSLSEQGLGKATHTLTLGEAGTHTTVTVVVDGEDANADITLVPAMVDLVWEAQSYVPPFYKGRTFPSPGTTITAEALPYFTKDGTIIDRGSVYFTWKYNEQLLQTQSGPGKSSITLNAPEFAEEGVLSVEAQTVDGIFSASKKVRIPTTEPYMTLYPVNPLIGVDFLRGGRSTVQTPDTESTFVLFPYFASIKDLLDPIANISWTIDGNPATAETTNPYKLVVISPQVGVRARIESIFSYENQIFLRVRRVWDVVFGTTLQSVGPDPFSRPVE